MSDVNKRAEEAQEVPTVDHDVEVNETDLPDPDTGANQTAQDDQVIQDEVADKPKKADTRMSALDWTLTICIPILVAILLHVFVVEAFIVPTGSMLSTIQLDDRVWAEKVTYRMREPERGEIVVFDSPVEDEIVLLKRVIATAGQTVDLQDGHVVVDGEVLDEPYTNDKPSYPLDRHAEGIEPISYPLVVPEGHVWLMGDNRTNSLDSRYYGPIPESSIIGRAFCTYWPLDHARLL